jgi:superfamily I DNA/RNA helicase
VNFSTYQQAIFEFVKSGRGSAFVEAVAGSGKTTTIVECAKLIPPYRSCTFVAFNKHIAEELSQRLPKHVQAKTLNALGYSAWIKHVGNRVRVDADKMNAILESMLGSEKLRVYRVAALKLIGLAKACGLVPHNIEGAVCLVEDDFDWWRETLEYYDIEVDDRITIEELVQVCREALAISIKCSDKVIDFNDQLYMPVIMRAKFWQNDFMFVDEAQDVNAIQRAMLKRALKAGGRLIAVGDPHQAIYGFRGADIQAVENIKQEFGMTTLPLTVSYRCPQLVVRKAQEYVNHIEASPTAAQGVVQTLEKWQPKDFTKDDAILCRNTAPLVTTAYTILRESVPCRILGREIGQGLVNLIKKMGARDIDSLLDRLDAYFERESAKFMAKGQEGKAAQLEDRVTTVRVFVEQLPEMNRTVPALITLIEGLFSDVQNGCLTLCTVHKAKGLEWNRVYILDEFLMPSKYARQAWQQQQETNLQYVAVTRAKQELKFIYTPRERK